MRGNKKGKTWWICLPPPTFNGMLMCSDKRQKESHAGIKDWDLRLKQHVWMQIFACMRFRNGARFKTEVQRRKKTGGWTHRCCFKCLMAEQFLISLIKSLGVVVWVDENKIKLAKSIKIKMKKSKKINIKHMNIHNHCVRNSYTKSETWKMTTGTFTH